MRTPRPPDWSSDEWTTPLDIVAEYAREFGPFDLDPCATSTSARAPRFFTKADNGLVRHWVGRVWLNAPYSNPAPWLWKAIHETRRGRASVVVALLPSTTDAAWFHDLVLPRADVRFRRGRIRFLGWEGIPINSPRAGNIVAIYRSAH